MSEEAQENNQRKEEAHSLIVKMAEVYQALGDTNRLHILGHLSIYKHNENDTLCVCDIAKQLGITQSAVSQHLKVLKHIGIVESIRKGFHKYYSVNFEKLRECMEGNKKLFEFAMTPCPEFFEDENCDPCKARQANTEKK